MNQTTKFKIFKILFISITVLAIFIAIIILATSKFY
jgi:hypothetical protein